MILDRLSTREAMISTALIIGVLTLAACNSPQSIDTQPGIGPVDGKAVPSGLQSNIAVNPAPINNLNAEPALAAGAIPTISPKIAHWVETKTSNPSPTPDLSARTYSGESGQIVSTAEKKFRINIITPKLWTAENKETAVNLDWSTEELKVLTTALDLVPPQCWAKGHIKQFVLVKPVGTSGGGPGGQHFDDGTIKILLPEGFNFHQPTYSKTIPDQKSALIISTIHEAIHQLTADNPEIVTSWAQQTGWKKGTGDHWSNTKPGELIRDGTLADKTPIEDIAESAGLLATNPKALSPDRINFFLTNPFFSDWLVAQKLKK